MSEISAWKSQRPFHVFFLVLAVIGYIKSESFVGFYIFIGSICITALFILIAKFRSKKGGGQ